MKIAAQPETFSARSRVVLVDVYLVRAHFGCTAENIFRRVDDATRPDHLRWVFNLSVGKGRRRNLRFWLRELIEPETCAGLTLGQVVDLILGRRQNFRRGELEVEWVCNASLFTRLIHARALILHGTTIPRQALANFLRARWIGGQE